MKRLWLGAGVLVLVGIGIWAVGTGIDRSDLTSGLNRAVLSTTAAIGMPRGRKRNAVRLVLDAGKTVGAVAGETSAPTVQ